MKRILDLSIIVISSPIWITIFFLIAIIVRFKIGKPILFSQPRVGLRGKVFTLKKFRTMSDEKDADGKLLSDEKRLSPFGYWLRSTSLDELPTLWNVIIGDLSLVGPRPLLIEYLPLYNSRQLRRHNKMPGITGWAQINGRNSISWEEKFELDIWYIENYNFILDVRILIITIKKVISRDGISSKDNATMPKFKG
tara:strand:- start:206 stop:790 length:585 start_codon:yes stop_codon:yes gene_type:complete